MQGVVTPGNIEVNSGKFMTIKMLERPTRVSKLEDWKRSLYYALKREVETLSEISHVNKLSPSCAYALRCDNQLSSTEVLLSRVVARNHPLPSLFTGAIG